MCLNRLIQSKKLSRDEIIVVSKAGPLIAGKTLEDVQKRATKGSGFNNTTFFDSRYGYSLDPEYFEYQITENLKALNLDVIDVFLIDTPEAIIPDKATEPMMAAYYKKIMLLFKYLESEVAKGRIQYYGISSSMMQALHSSYPSNISLDMFLRIAEEIAPGNQHFAMIQYPFNLLEPQFAHNYTPNTSTTYHAPTTNIPTPESIKEVRYDAPAAPPMKAILWDKLGRDRSVQLIAQTAGLIQLAIRPIKSQIALPYQVTSPMGITPRPAPHPTLSQMFVPDGLMYKLRDEPGDPQDGRLLANKVKQQITACLSLERTYHADYQRREAASKEPEKYAIKKSPERNALEGRPHMREVSWMQICLGNLARLDLETFKVSTTHQMLPALLKTTEQIRKIDPDWIQWTLAYESCFRNFVELNTIVLETNRHHELLELVKNLHIACDTLEENPTLSAKAVRICQSSLLTSTCIGMLTTQHVSDIVYGGGSATDPRPMTPLDPTYLTEIFKVGSNHVMQVQNLLQSQYESEERIVLKHQQQPHPSTQHD